jgi:hypothetical protein
MFQKHPFRHFPKNQAVIWYLHVQLPSIPWLPRLSHPHRLLNPSRSQTIVPLSQQFNVCSKVQAVSATAKGILTAGPNTYVPKAPIQALPPLSGRHLAPSRTMVTNSQAPFPEVHIPIYTSTPKSVTPANHGAKPSPSHIRPSVCPSTKTLTSARPLTSPTRVLMSVASSTPPSSSSSDIMRLDKLQSSGGPPPLVGSKRRLGMGRGGAGYSNKKFKTPGL